MTSQPLVLPDQIPQEVVQGLVSVDYMRHVSGNRGGHRPVRGRHRNRVSGRGAGR